MTKKKNSNSSMIARKTHIMATKTIKRIFLWQKKIKMYE